MNKLNKVLLLKDIEQLLTYLQTNMPTSTYWHIDRYSPGIWVDSLYGSFGILIKNNQFLLSIDDSDVPISPEALALHLTHMYYLSLPVKSFDTAIDPVLPL